MIYFCVTTCVFNKCPIRKSQYNSGITKLKQIIHDLNIKNYKIIIIENNGNRKTFLDDFNCDVFYTNNNSIPTKNKGIKELQDIIDCIKHYDIKDSDFIVKITGRYILYDNSEFMSVIKNIETTNYNCVIKYGPYFKPENYKTHDCITGLIGMTCNYVKQIKMPKDNECVEWKWADVTYMIEDATICMVKSLGISICPGGNKYFNV